MLIVKEDLLPIGHPNRPGTKLSGIKARVHHGTANWAKGADDIMNGKYAGRPYVKKWNQSLGKYEFFEVDGTTPFAYGIAHVYIDTDSAVIKIPLDEVTYNCGDRPNPYTNGYKGQTKLATEVFGNMNNSYTWSIELCMNDMSTAGWQKVQDNAIEFIQKYMPRADIEDYRHYDMTGKICPSPLVDNSPGLCPAWVEYRNRVRAALKVSDPISDSLNHAIKAGLITDTSLWGRVLRGEIPANPEYLRIIFNRAKL